MLRTLAAVFMFITCACACRDTPAIQVILTNKGLQYGTHAGAGWIQEKLDNVTLPVISGELHIGIFGRINYMLKGMRITKCDFPEPSVEFNQDVSGFNMSVSGLSVALTGGWFVRYGIIHWGGSMDVALFSVDLTSVVQLGKDADGHLSVNSVRCDAQVGDMDLHLHGGGRIPQLAADLFKGLIKREIEAKICLSVEESIVDLEQHLQAMKVSFEVNEDLSVDLPLTDSPVIDASALTLGLKGKFYSVKTHQDPPFKPQPFTLRQPSAYMLSAGLSDFTVNSASYGYFSAGLFQALINDSLIPPSSPVHLNTSSMGPFIPQLPQLFPGLLMELQLYARECPVVSFQADTVKLSFLGAAKAFAIQPNATRTPLFKLHIDSEFSNKVFIAGGRLKGSIAMDSFTLTLAASEVGFFKTDALENMSQMVMKMVVLSKVNKKLDEGFALPRMKHAQLVNCVLKVEEGFIAISADAEVFTARTLR